MQGAKKTGDNTYKIFYHIPIAIGFSCNGHYESYFGLGCIKNLLEIETENNFNLNKTVIFNKENQ